MVILWEVRKDTALQFSSVCNVMNVVNWSHWTAWFARCRNIGEKWIIVSPVWSLCEVSI